MLHHFALLDKLQTLTEGGVQLWVTFGTGTNLRYLAAHDITRPFVNGTALALPAFHAFTGCDTVSCFHGRGKKKALHSTKWKERKLVFPSRQTRVSVNWNVSVSYVSVVPATRETYHFYTRLRYVSVSDFEDETDVSVMFKQRKHVCNTRFRYV